MNAKIENAIKSTKNFMCKHSPEILTGIGLAGMITSTVLAVKATPKALILIDNYKKKNNIDALTFIETTKVAWKPYIPAGATGLASAMCIIGAVRVNSKRNAALTAAYAISERTLLRYRDKVIETIGENKEKKIMDKISQEDVENNPVSKSQVIITPKGNTLCRDAYSGRYFRSDIDQIRKIVNELNRTMTYDNYISLGEYYDKIGLDHIQNDSRIGWNIDHGLIDLDISACLAENDEPCIVINFVNPPKVDFDRFL